VALALLRIFAGMVLFVAGGLSAAETYDLVLANGRVMDPETGLDAVRNVAINGDRIVEVSSDSLNGRRRIDVTGLVVATRIHRSACPWPDQSGE
jgi:adenine deaminase